MDRETIIAELRMIIGDYLKKKGLDLVELIYRYEGKDLVLRTLVDDPGRGISLNECACLNNEISRILEEKAILQDNYILEVSSPGLDRPLRVKSDFSRCINRKVRFFLSQAINGKMELEGLITKVSDDSVFIDSEAVMWLEIPLTKIVMAKQIITFPPTR